MEYVKEICRKFISDRTDEICSIGDGRINETFCVRTEKMNYICQRIRKKMNLEILERNYHLYSAALDRAKLDYPKWLRDQEDQFFYTDGSGEHWRMYPMITGEIRQAPLTEAELFACGRALAGMHTALQDMKEKPGAVYPMLHDLAYYYKEYLWVLEHDLSGEERDADLEKYIASHVEVFLHLQADRSAVIHGDPKLGNILFSAGKVSAFIDLDTVMQGSPVEDVADCIRSCCVREGKVDDEAQQIFLQGYLSEDHGILKEEELACLPQVIAKIRFELGLRYYTDAVAKQKHFKEKYPGYLMEKARSNFAAV